MDFVIRLLFGFILAVGPLTIAVMVGSWAWQDARERGCSRLCSLLAVVLVFIFFPVGLGLWLLLRPEPHEVGGLRPVRIGASCNGQPLSLMK